MYGEFVAVTGEYNFRYGGVIDKKFQVRPGGTILWERDPLAAQLNLEAVYKLNANPAPLLDNQGFTGRIPTEVVVRLDGELENPNINFDIDFPGTIPLYNLNWSTGFRILRSRSEMHSSFGAGDLCQ